MMSFYKYSAMAGRLIRSSQTAAFRPQGLTPLVEENPMPAFQFTSSAVQAAEIKSQEVKQPEGLGTLATGDFAGKKYTWVTEPYGVPGTRGVVPNTPRFRRLMKFQSEWSNSSEFVWKLRGTPDMIVYYGILGWTLALMSMCGYGFYQLMFPKKKE